MGKEQEGATERLLREVQRLGKGAGIGGGRNTSEGLYQVYLGGAGPGLVSNCTLLLGSSSLLPAPCSLFPAPCSLLPVPCKNSLNVQYVVQGTWWTEGPTDHTLGVDTELKQQLTNWSI